jgi:hypothetical protein
LDRAEGVHYYVESGEFRRISQKAFLYTQWFGAAGGALVDMALHGPLTRLPMHEAVVGVVVLQVLVWLLTAAVLDGGGCFRACSGGLAIYWLGVALLGQAAWRSWLGRLYVEAGWVLVLAVALLLRAAVGT